MTKIVGVEDLTHEMFEKYYLVPTGHPHNLQWYLYRPNGSPAE